MAKKFMAIGRPAPRQGDRLLVTGSRYWTNVEKIYDVISEAHEAAGGMLIVVEGDCKGADKLAGMVAKELEIKVEAYPADWDKYGNGAGAIRNQLMLDESRRNAFSDGYQLRCAVAFHEDLANSRGTRDMVTRLEAAGIPVLKVAR